MADIFTVFFVLFLSFVIKLCDCTVHNKNGILYRDVRLNLRELATHSFP